MEIAADATGWEIRCAKCEACITRHEEELEGKRLAGIEEAKFKAQKSVEDLIPDRLWETDFNSSKFNKSLWEKVQEWKPTGEEPWLGLVGLPGLCKSRCCFHWLHGRVRSRITEPSHRLSVEVASGYDFYELVMDLFSKERGTRSWMSGEEDLGPAGASRAKLRRFKHADYLIFDDIGKVRPTPVCIRELATIINYRHANNLITLWSANNKPEEFATSWPEEHAAPIAGRIVEASTIIEV
jgi:hypothetical protein